MTVPSHIKYNADACKWSSFIPEFTRFCLDLVLSDRLVSRVLSHAVSTNSMRAMLYEHRHEASLISISNRQ
jgi:hypothetical protein